MKILLDRFNAGGGGEGDYQVIMAGTLLLDPADDHPVRRRSRSTSSAASRSRGGRGSGVPAVGVGCRRGGRRRALARRPMLGLDIGGTKLAAGVVDGDGACAGSSSRRPRPRAGRSDGLARLFALGRQRGRGGGRRVGRDRRRSGSAAAGRSTRARGVLVAPLHLPGWTDVPIVELAAARVRPAGGARERRDRRGRGRAPLRRRARARATWSTSRSRPASAAASCSTARLYRGASGQRRRARPRHGRLARPRVPRLRPARLPRGVRVRARRSPSARARRGWTARRRPTSPRRARAGDAGASAVWDETCEALACGITSIVNLFEPELVVIGGGVSRDGRAAARAGARARARAGDRASRARGRGRRGRRSATRSASSAPRRSRTSASRREACALSVGRAAEPKRSPSTRALVARRRRAASAVDEVARLIVAAYERGGRVYTFGNGGSAADAQHFAEELVGRFKRERRPLAGAVALSVDPSVAHLHRERLLVRRGLRAPGAGARARRRRRRSAITTSGRSPNVVRGAARGARAGATTVLFAGGDGVAGRRARRPRARRAVGRRRRACRRCTCC